MEVNNQKCISIKSLKDKNLQCPHPRKFGDFCGIHSKSKNVICFDQQDRIMINLTFKKQDKEKKEPEFYDNLKDLQKMNQEDINYAKLIKTLRLFKIQIKGPKVELIRKLLKYLEDYQNIQETYKNLELCNNTTDFYDFIDIKDIPKKYLFIFKCVDQKFYAMDLRSIHTYFKQLDKDSELLEQPVEYKNPYNRMIFSTTTIADYKKRIKNLVDQGQEITYPDTDHNPEDELTFKVLEVFNMMHTFGYIIDASWFLNMSRIELLDYYIAMEDIWNMRLGLNLSIKRLICPYNVNIFNRAEFIEIREMAKLDLQNLMIDKIKHLISDANDRENKILGINYCLMGLAEVCDIDNNGGIPF